MFKVARWIRSRSPIKGFSLLLAIPLLMAVGCSNDADRLARHQQAGDQFMANQQYREAVIEYRNAVQLAPESAAHHYQLGQALLNLGTQSDLHNAFTEFSKAVQSDPEHLEAQLKLGLMYLVSGEAETALEKARFILTRQPDNSEAQMLGAQALSTLGEHEKARKEFMAVLKREPDSIPAHTGLAAVLVAQKRLNEAETHFKAAVDVMPDSPKSRLLLAAFYGGAGRDAKAVAELEEVIRRSPDTIPAYTALARYYLKDGDGTRAADTLAQLIKVKPTHYAGYQALASLHSQLRNTEEAKKVLADGIAKAEDTIALRVQLADLLIQSGQLDQVAAQAKALSQNEDGQVMGRFFTGLVALAERRFQEATDAFNQVVKDQPKMPMAYYYLGKTYQITGDINAAKEAYATAVDQAPELVPPRVALAQLRLREGNLDEVRAHVDKLREVAPGLPDTLHLSGLLALADHNLKQAERDFKAVIKLLPESAEAYTQLGRTRLAMGDAKAGRQALDKALTIDPNRVDALELLLKADVNSGHAENAVKRARQAAKDQPDNPEVQFLLGRLLVERGDVQSGIAAFEAALKADKTYLPAYGALGQMYASEERYDEAISRLNQSVEQDPNNAGSLMLLGVIHEQSGNIPQAIEHYKKVLDILPEFAPAANNLAWLYSHGNGNLDVAMTLAQTAWEHAPDDAGVADTLGWIYHQKGVYLKARGLLGEALKSMPDHPVVLYHMGANSLKLEQKELARDYLKKALASPIPFPERADAEAALKMAM